MFEDDKAYWGHKNQQGQVVTLSLTNCCQTTNLSKKWFLEKSQVSTEFPSQNSCGIGHNAFNLTQKLFPITSKLLGFFGWKFLTVIFFCSEITKNGQFFLLNAFSFLDWYYEKKSNFHFKTLCDPDW